LGEKFPDVSVSGITYFDLANGEVENIRDSEEGGMAHAGEFETSLMEYYHPELVQKSDAEGELLEQSSSFAFKDMFSGGPMALYRPFEEYSSNGCVGAPEVASLEKGEKFQEIVASTLHELILEENQNST
jgi:creatinine amidohydrolase